MIIEENRAEGNSSVCYIVTIVYFKHYKTKETFIHDVNILDYNSYNVLASWNVRQRHLQKWIGESFLRNAWRKKHGYKKNCWLCGFHSITFARSFFFFYTAALRYKCSLWQMYCHPFPRLALNRRYFQDKRSLRCTSDELVPRSIEYDPVKVSREFPLIILIREIERNNVRKVNVICGNRVNCSNIVTSFGRAHVLLRARRGVMKWM